MSAELRKKLDSEEFYELMQAYRHAPLTDQEWTTQAFEHVKEFIESAIESSLQAALAERTELTFRGFALRNRTRCEHPQGFNHKLSGWSISDWFTAVLGELGEAANIAKKLNRVRDGIPGNKESTEELQEKLRKELGDVFVYLDLLAQLLGFNIGDAALEVFEIKSAEIGYQASVSPDFKSDPFAATKLMSPAVEIIKFYARHRNDCSGAAIACSCGLSQLRHKAYDEIAAREKALIHKRDQEWIEAIGAEDLEPRRPVNIKNLVAWFCDSCMSGPMRDIKRLETDNAALRELMPCGHPKACLVEIPCTDPECKPDCKAEMACKVCRQLASAERRGRLEEAMYWNRKPSWIGSKQWRKQRIAALESAQSPQPEKKQ